ncbi:NAD-dependent epimerase/dehydratase family protein [Mangrovihabitans endophyticus]|uniref:NAD-dependent epimerase/dehydratase domain-containing protein n=1 Tax=Mangrovihabitans endophyticus TaxID=1751298 RepID=A0A8J3C5B8_9ACTN|nr:NAD-dependent epimerase/dehydratase family protein [Mangrovihabitans endophyticus]GGL21177.1 hypothetical protein GCM10012284_64820 [Mangrovihabitans endophyticus]
MEDGAIYIVGGRGYVGSRAVKHVINEGGRPVVVSRNGEGLPGVPSFGWREFLSEIAASKDREGSIVWLLDGEKHQERERLTEVIDVVGTGVHIAAASSCTLYGDVAGRECDEDAAIQSVTANARLKESCEAALAAASQLSWTALRFGALYGVDDRGLRRDRVEKWVREAVEGGTVTVPDPTHWRGWLHRDQAARAIVRAAARRHQGILNVASFNARFSDVASIAAAPFGAHVVSDGKEDPMNYQINSDKARAAGLLDERKNEGLGDEVEAFNRKISSANS